MGAEKNLEYSADVEPFRHQGIFKRSERMLSDRVVKVYWIHRLEHL